MRTRVLPADEWARLDGTSLGRAWRLLPTSGVTVVVVEHGGAIVGHAVLFHAVHAEDWWVAEDHRKKGVVVGHLVDAVKVAARQQGAGAFVTASDSTEVTQLLGHLGAARLPGAAYAVPAGD